MLEHRRFRSEVFAAPIAVALTLDSTWPCIAKSTTLESPNLSGDAAGGVGFNRNPGATEDLSLDGRFAIFTSTATDLVSGITDSNGGADVFLRDLESGTTAILSVDAAGTALGTTGNAGIGLETCENCVCDVDGSGSITATDALRTLKIAVGQPLEIAGPVC